MTVRSATADDVEAIRAVAEAAWRADYPAVLNRENVDDAVEEWYAPDRLAEALGEYSTVAFVAESGREVVGFVHAVWDREEGDVLRVYVAPDHRGEGLGRALVERACEELFDRGVDRVKAMVLAANERGNEFYRALGFAPTDEGGETEIGGERYEERVYVREDRFPA